MLYTNFYIIESNQLVGLDGKGYDGIIAIPAQMQNLADIYVIASSLPPSITFCLYLDKQPVIDKKTTLDIIAFFFLPGYYQNRGNPQLLVSNSNEKDFLNFATLLTECAMAQGFENIDITQITDSTDHSGQIYVDHEISKIGDAYAQLMSTSENFDKGLYIRTNGVDGIDAVGISLREKEEEIAAGNPVVYFSKKEIKKYEQELRKLKGLLQSAEQELTNHQSHIALLRSNSYASQLQRYYDNEYETLPGWYKKLGQLIKALSGKRTFTSLFSKNVKKYKD